ncbi:hypothetical protein [Polaromonas sp.]|jgi:hypothetical protein|nr:hypothetical protein [Polaromonas sp.]HQS31387.1 hypothetical protein [Polaromonas sp.]HQS90712.1 hypothetical protein [Polaromonas sp.]
MSDFLDPEGLKRPDAAGHAAKAEAAPESAQKHTPMMLHYERVTF